MAVHAITIICFMTTMTSKGQTFDKVPHHHHRPHPDRWTKWTTKSDRHGQHKNPNSKLANSIWRESEAVSRASEVYLLAPSSSVLCMDVPVGTGHGVWVHHPPFQPFIHRVPECLLRRPNGRRRPPLKQKNSGNQFTSPCMHAPPFTIINGDPPYLGGPMAPSMTTWATWIPRHWNSFAKHCDSALRANFPQPAFHHGQPLKQDQQPSDAMVTYWSILQFLLLPLLLLPFLNCFGKELGRGPVVIDENNTSKWPPRKGPLV